MIVNNTNLKQIKIYIRNDWNKMSIFTIQQGLLHFHKNQLETK